MPELRVVRSELILGGPQSGKTARAESLAAVWLAQASDHRAVFIATAQAWDEEMRERVARHQRRRAQRVPAMATVEEPLELAHAIGRYSRSDTLIVVDCLTLWLTARLMPAVVGPEALPAPERPPDDTSASLVKPPREATIANALSACAGPVVLISNEPGAALDPAGLNMVAFFEALGGMNQEAAAACERVTLMSAGMPLTLKESA